MADFSVIALHQDFQNKKMLIGKHHDMLLALKIHSNHILIYF